MSVYFDKTSEDIQDFDNEAMRQGRDLEEYVARRFTEETGFKVRRANAIYQNTAYPFMLANVDRLLVGERIGLECKTTSAYNADKWADGLISPHYEIQCHHYMAVTGAAAWYLAVVILGRGFKIVKIDRDEEIIQNLITVEEDFWNEHVTKRMMPEPDGSGISDEIITRCFPKARKQEILLPSDFNEALKRREDITGLIDKLEQE